MDYLQYNVLRSLVVKRSWGFKPYYKWITFNTVGYNLFKDILLGFKPYYKWITFNTDDLTIISSKDVNCFKPYYKWITFNTELDFSDEFDVKFFQF